MFTSVRSIRVLRSAALGVAVGGALLAQQGCAQPGGGQQAGASPGAVEQVGAASSASAEPSASATAKPQGDGQPEHTDWMPGPASQSEDGVFNELWQTSLVSTEMPAGRVTVDSKLRVMAIKKNDDRTLFSLKRVKGDKYLIRTAKLLKGGTPYCLEVQDEKVADDNSMPLIAKTCDARINTQLFTFESSRLAGGKKVWVIRGIEKRYLQFTSDFNPKARVSKLVAAPIGDGGPGCFFTLPDRGMNTLPHD